MNNNTLIHQNNTITVNVEVILFQEEHMWVSYCPALDLSSYGETKPEAKKAFEEVMDIFVTETLEKKTLEKYLLSQGWTLQKTLYRPPHSRLGDMKKYADKKGEVYEQYITLPIYG